MSQSIANRHPQTPAQSLRAGSQSAAPSLDGIRAGSSMLRMTAKTDRASVIRLLLDAKRDAGVSQQAIALNAEQTESVISESLSMTGKRNFTLEWFCDQDDAFIVKFVEHLFSARGITRESKRQVAIDRMKELFGLLVDEAVA